MDSFSVRPTIKSQLGTIFLAASLATIAYRSISLEHPAAILLAKVIAAASLFIVLLGLHYIYNVKYTFSHDFILAIEGILSLNMQQTKVRYEDIKFVEVHKSILGRIFDYGNLHVASAATSDIEITMKSISHPLLFKEFVMGQVEAKRGKKQPPEAAESKNEISRATTA